MPRYLINQSTKENAIKYVNEAIQYFGGRVKLARLLGVTPQFVGLWKTGESAVPIDRALEIEYHTKGKIKAQNLRNDKIILKKVSVTVDNGK